MKKIKIYAQTEGSVVININKQPKPYVSITDESGYIISFYKKEEYDSYLEFRKDNK